MTDGDQDVFTITTAVGGVEEVRGKPIGRASSRVNRHNHKLSDRAQPYRRCSACRWTEITIVRRDDGRYALISEGISSIQGEIAYGRVSVASSPEEAVQRLHRSDLVVKGEVVEPFLPVVARKALINAASCDPPIAEVMRSRGFM